MTDKQEPQNPPADDDSDAEKHYWDEHKTRTRAILDEWFEEKKKEVVGTARNGGRATLPKIFADIVFGPAEK